MKNAKKKQEKEKAETNGFEEETSAENISGNIEGQTAEAVSSGQNEQIKSIYALKKGTSETVLVDQKSAYDDLSNDWSEKQIEKLFTGDGTLATNTHVYSCNEAKLQEIAHAEGWSNAEQVTELEYVPDDEGTEFVPDAEFEEVQQLDPNQPIYLALENDDFRSTLTSKEVTLAIALSGQEKFVANLNKSDAKLLQSIQKKFEKFQSLDADGQEPIERFQKKDALAKRETEAIDAIPELPLSEEEVSRKLELEAVIDDAKAKGEEAQKTVEKSALTLMRAAAEIRDKRLFREEEKSFDVYFHKRFGVSLNYASNLAQYGGFLGVLTDGKSVIPEESLNTTIVRKLTEGANKVADEMGLEKSEFAVLRPIIENTARIITDLSTDEQGNVKINPKIVAQVQQTVAEVARTGVVTIDGESMTLEEAKEKGLLNLAVQAEVVETVAEQIKTQKQFIFDEARKAEARRFAPHEPATPNKSDKPQFTGVVPTYSISCDNPNHKEANKKNSNRIVKVFNAGFELACGCKFQRLTTSGDEFVCIQTDGLEIQH